jgi:trimeric autotransporter adhesin
LVAAQQNSDSADQAKSQAEVKKALQIAQEAAAKAAAAKAAAAAADAKAAAAAAASEAAAKAAAAASRRKDVDAKKQQVAQAESVISQKKDAAKRVSDALNNAINDLANANKQADQAKDRASKAQAHSNGSDDRIKAAARVYAQSVISFNNAANEHTKTFGSKKSDLHKNNVDVIDCAQYGGCNNNANGAGGVGVNVDNTNIMLGHKKAVASAKSELEKSLIPYNAASAAAESATRAYISAQSVQQRAQVANNQAVATGRKCYSVTVSPSCSGGSCGQNKGRQISVDVKFPAADLVCPSHVDKSNWLSKDKYNDAFDVRSYKDHAQVTRTDSKGPWGMTVVMKCCDTEIEKAQAALKQANSNLEAARSKMTNANNDLARARARRDAAQNAHSAATNAQKNQKY